MSTTTVADLLDRAELLTATLQRPHEPITLAEWRSFELTLRHLLHQLVATARTAEPEGSQSHAALVRLLNNYPRPAAPSRRRTSSPITTEATAPADPASTHALDRLTVAFGALADLLAVARDRNRDSQPNGSTLHARLTDTQTRPVIVQVLAIAAVAGRLAARDFFPEDNHVPESLACYAEHGLVLLGRDQPASSALLDLACHAPPQTPVGPNEELEAALRTWVDSARRELRHGIPSTDVLANIADQGLHLYATTDALLVHLASDDLPTGAVPNVRAQLRAGAIEMRRLEKLWAKVTTAAKPTHEYVAAATRIYQVLNQLTSAQPPPGDLDQHQAIHDLRHATADLAELTHIGQTVPDTLARSRLLFAPARILPTDVDRLHDRQLGRWTTVAPHEITTLRRQSAVATRAADRVHLTLTTLAGRRTHPEQAATPLARDLPRSPLSHELSPEAHLPSLA